MTINGRKTALVFGGARGIGAAAVGRVLKDGFDAAFTYVPRPDSAHALAGKMEKPTNRRRHLRARSGTRWVGPAGIHAVRCTLDARE